MNIFYLHPISKICALYHCDKHVVKMIVETAQLLSTAHHEHQHPVTYKPTHVNHPSAIWARSSRLHYLYLVDLGKALCTEYTKRYHKTHACEAMYYGELKDPPPSLTYSGWSNPPQCMPDEYKNDDTVTAYRQYYRHKQHVITMKWYQDSAYAPDWMVA